MTDDVQRRRILAATEPARSLVSGHWPGLMASDLSTRVLRTWLSRLGYPVVGWALGRKRGPTQEVVDELPRLLDRLARRARGAGERRRLESRRHLCPPAGRAGSPAGPAGDLAGLSVLPRRFAGATAAVPSTAVYSKWDGVVDWRACRQEPGPTSENVAVRASHLGMGHDPAVLGVMADRLAQPRAAWRPFQRPTRFGLAALFPDG